MEFIMKQDYKKPFWKLKYTNAYIKGKRKWVFSCIEFLQQIIPFFASFPQADDVRPHGTQFDLMASPNLTCVGLVQSPRRPVDHNWHSFPIRQYVFVIETKPQKLAVKSNNAHNLVLHYPRNFQIQKA